jgi:hypothetical protein
MVMGILATVHLQSASQYSGSRFHDTPKKPKELPGDYELRTWREKCYFNHENKVVLPSVYFKKNLVSAAQYLAEKVPGKGMKTWTQYFTSAVAVENDIVLPVRKDDLEPITLPCDSKGRRNRSGGSLVLRTFPIVKSWEGVLRVRIYDETITQEIFTRVFQHAGIFIGIGRFRPQNGGDNGRYIVKEIRWQKLENSA